MSPGRTVLSGGFRVYARSVDPERARKLLSIERERIMEGIHKLAPGESDEPTATDQHMSDQASDLYDAELDEGFSDELRDELAAVERAEQRLAAGTYGCRSRAANRSRTSVSRPSPPLSGQSKGKLVSSAKTDSAAS